MKTSVYNKEGKEVGQVTLPKEIFEVPMSTDLLHQITVAQRANRRQISAHTKDRGDVSGGGKKPWRQKGTGRARHGSIRSPIWKGGGVTFGPTKDKVFKKRIPTKMRRKALLMALSVKAKEKMLIVLDELKVDKIKTKPINEIFNNLPCKDKKCLVVLPNMDKNVVLSARNIANIETVEARNLNALDILSFKYLIMSKESIKAIKETFLK